MEANTGQGSPPLARDHLLSSLERPHFQGASGAQMGVWGEMGPGWLPWQQNLATAERLPCGFLQGCYESQT